METNLETLRKEHLMQEQLQSKFKVNYNLPDEEIYNIVTINGVDYRHPNTKIVKQMFDSADLAEYLGHIYKLTKEQLICLSHVRYKCARAFSYAFFSNPDSPYERYPFVHSQN